MQHICVIFVVYYNFKQDWRITTLFLHTAVSERLHTLSPSWKPFHSFVMGILYSSHIDSYQSLLYVGEETGFPINSINSFVLAVVILYFPLFLCGNMNSVCLV